MAQSSQLREQYDDALAALLMAQVQEADGQRILTRAESGCVPQGAQGRLLHTLQAAQRRRARCAAVRRWCRWLRRGATALVIVLALLIGVYAASEHVRIRVWNFALEHRNAATDFLFRSVLPPREPEPEKLLEAAEVYCPEGFTLSGAVDEGNQLDYTYTDPDGNSLSILAYNLSNGATTLSLDTENAQITEETICGQKVTKISKLHTGRGANKTFSSCIYFWYTEQPPAAYVVMSEDLPEPYVRQLAETIITQAAH